MNSQNLIRIDIVELQEKIIKIQSFNRWGKRNDGISVFQGMKVLGNGKLWCKWNNDDIEFDIDELVQNEPEYF